MRLLVTRPEPEASAFAARLGALGHEVTVDPMLVVDLEGADPIDLAGAAAVIATSRNALRALARDPAALAAAPALPLLAVGPGTAQAAREIGIRRVVEGPSDARALVAVIAAEVGPTAGSIVHLAGETLAFDLAAPLRAAGYDVRQQVVYRTRPADRLAPATVRLIAQGRLDAVILMSPLTAQTFARCLAEAGLEAAAAPRLLYLCLSVSVAEKVGPLAGRIAVAQRPNSEEMLALVCSAATHSGPKEGRP